MLPSVQCKCCSPLLPTMPCVMDVWSKGADMNESINQSNQFSNRIEWVWWISHDDDDDDHLIQSIEKHQGQKLMRHRTSPRGMLGYDDDGQREERERRPKPGPTRRGWPTKATRALSILLRRRLTLAWRIGVGFCQGRHGWMARTAFIDRWWSQGSLMDVMPVATRCRNQQRIQRQGANAVAHPIHPTIAFRIGERRIPWRVGCPLAAQIQC